MTIELKVFAHFCSEFVDIWSSWRELHVLLAQRQPHQVFEGVDIPLRLKVFLNLGSVLIL